MRARSTFPNKSPTSWASFTVPCRRATPTRTCWRCRPGRYPTVEEAESYPYTERELAILRHAHRRTVAGAPEQVRERLEALAAEYEADELIIVTITHDPKARRRSYELLAKVFGLEEAGP